LYEVLSGADGFTAAWHGGAVGLLLLAVGGIASGLWKGHDVQSAQGPAGFGIGMEPADAAEDTVATLNDRVTAQMEDVSKRFLAQDERITRLEGEVFIKSSPTR
jgi:hypothetical protein